MNNNEIVNLIKEGINVQDNIQKLYKQNEGLIYLTAKSFTYSGEPLEDLLQQSYFGLISAVDNFDRSKGYEFSTYLTTSIRNELARYTAHSSNNVSVPEGLKSLVIKYNKLISEELREHNKIPSDKTICAILNITDAELINIRNADTMLNLDSLDRAIEVDGVQTDIGSYICDTENNIENYVEETSVNEANTQLWHTVEALPPKSSKVIKMYYKDKLPFSEIAKRCNCSPETIRRIHYDAVKRLERKIKALEIYTMDLYNVGTQHTGFASYSHSWTSQTENVALKLYKLDKLKECLK